MTSEHCIERVERNSLKCCSSLYMTQSTVACQAQMGTDFQCGKASVKLKKKPKTTPPKQPHPSSPSTEESKNVWHGAKS